MGHRKPHAVLLALMLLATATLVIATPVAADDQTYIDDEVELIVEEVDDGKYVRISMGDSNFGVFFGTDDKPNEISLISTYTRYLGVAEITDDDGDYQKAGIPVETVFGQTLHGILEFDDENGDSLFTMNGTDGAGNLNELSDSPNLTYEYFYKTIGFDTGWDLSTITSTYDDQTQFYTWDFTLTARNLTYDMPDNQQYTADVGNGVLDEMQLIFHIESQKSELNVENVPVYEISINDFDVESNDDVVFHSSEHVRDDDYTGVKLDSDFKFDASIQGWDYQNLNNTISGNDTSLVMITDAGAGTLIQDVIGDWMREEFGNDTDPVAVIDGINEDGTDEGTNTTLVHASSIQFEDGDYAIGNIAWVSNASVDGDDNSQVRFQVQSSRPVSEEDLDNRNQTGSGVLLIGGYIYEKGQDIYHDPSYSVSFVTFEPNQDGGNRLLRILLVAGGIFLLVAIVIGILVVVKIRRGRQSGAAQAIDTGATTQPVNYQDLYLQR